LASFIRTFETVEDLLSIKEQLNELVYSQCENPYFLYSFVEQFFELAIKKGVKPFFLVYFAGQKVVGFAPLVIRSWKIFRIASFLTDRELDPDFVVQEEYREDFLRKTVDFLFKKVRCNLINFSLPSETKSLPVLKMISKPLGTYFLTRPVEGHAVLPVEETWTEFEKRRGRKFQKFFSSIERKMALLGMWKVVFVTKQDSQAEILEDILEIEKASWKQSYREHRGLETDKGLLGILTAASNTSFEPGFSWQVAFLEIGGKKIAYNFWFAYKGTGFFCKTSFDNDFRKYYPGVYINNAVIREIFINSAIKQIDFMTSLPFHARWTPKIVPRTRIIISNSPIPIVIAKTLQNRYILPVRSNIGKAIYRILPVPVL
jgi:hypothetical protein